MDSRSQNQHESTRDRPSKQPKRERVTEGENERGEGGGGGGRRANINKWGGERETNIPVSCLHFSHTLYNPNCDLDQLQHTETHCNTLQHLGISYGGEHTATQHAILNCRGPYCLDTLSMVPWGLIQWGTHCKTLSHNTLISNAGDRSFSTPVIGTSGSQMVGDALQRIVMHCNILQHTVLNCRELYCLKSLSMVP